MRAGNYAGSLLTSEEVHYETETEAIIAVTEKGEVEMPIYNRQQKKQAIFPTVSKKTLNIKEYVKCQKSRNSSKKVS